tara:strand:- start:47 stop:1063 length:1017 start_codon:yes stop_codon:yes gene_type:complete
MRWFQLDPSYWFYYAADWCRDELDGTRTGAVGIQFLELVAQLWYWLIIGALLSALASHYLPRTRLGDLLTQHRIGSVVGASVLGLVSPLCTFAAIPVVSRVLKSGVPAPPLMAFLFASPLMNPALFAYTYGALGLEMATARSLTALSIGLGAGLGTHLLQLWGLLVTDMNSKRGLTAVAGGSGVVATVQQRSLARRFVQDLGFISRWFALGLFIAALTATFLSPDLIRSILGSGSRWSVPAAVLMGVPLYACGGGAIPIVETMIRLGMTQGAALAFFIAGPATKFHTLGALGAVFGRRVLAWYLLVMIVAALGWGYLYPFTEVLSGFSLPDIWRRGYS